MADTPLFTDLEPFEYSLEFRSHVYEARRVVGTEGISRPFRFEFFYRTKPGDLPEPETFVGNEAILRVRRSGMPTRHLMGVVTDASLEATATGAPELHVVLEPQLSLLAHRSDHRVFRDMTVPEIVSAVLLENRVGTIPKLEGTYKRRPYTVTYGETLFAFVHRLLEEEGIFYTFAEFVDEDSRPEAPALQHGLVLGDGIHAYAPIDGVARIPRRNVASLDRTDESVFGVKRTAKMRPGRVSLRDWNLEKPSLDMDVSADIARYDADTVHGPEVYLYPGRFEIPSEGQRFATLMAEAHVAASERIRGRSDTSRLIPGRTVELEPDSELIGVGVLSEEIVLVEVTHDYRRAHEESGKAEPAKLDVTFEALPVGVVFRPLRVTPRPEITNPLTAIVVGPPGEDIHTDSFGRVKIHFPWDRYQPKDDKASHWVPVMQENTGTSASIPRVGWEVAVGFVAGDPDRPFVLGRVYNGKDPFPEPLPANKTKSALRSLSSPGRDGHNEIWIEDAAGRELVSVQAEKDQNVVVARNKKEDVLNLEENTIIKDETIVIGANNTVTVKKQEVHAVDGDQTLTVAGARSRKVKAADQLTVSGSRSVSVGSLHFRKVGGFDNVAEKKSLGETIGGVEIEASLKANSTNADLVQTLTVGGAVIEVAGQGKEEKVDKLRVETIGGMLITAVSEKFSLKAVKKRATKVGMTLLAKAKTLRMASDDKDVKLTALATGRLHADTTLEITVGKSSVILSSAGIMMNTDQTTEISASGKSDLVSKQADFK